MALMSDLTLYLIEKYKQTELFQNVFDGDQRLIGEVPAMCVIGGRWDRTLATVPHGYDNVMEIYLLIYHSQIQSTSENYREAMELAEASEYFIHNDKTLGDTVINAYVSAGEPGYISRARTLWRSCRLTVNIRARDNLGL